MFRSSDSCKSDPHMLSVCGMTSRSWPFEEARKLVDRISIRDPDHVVLFETGYGPSGLPHIGTFGEVIRTAAVRHAFHVLTNHEVNTRLICFSDDMDGMRKIPDDVPNQDLLQAYLGLPLSKVPNPFSDDYPSFAHHNNARMCNFLDRFNLDYEFISASDHYASGRFDDMLLRMLARYEDVMEIVLPVLRKERRMTYSPFLPIHPETGVVMQVPIDECDVSAGAIVWTDPATSMRYKTSILGGGCKAQWRADWALRWASLGVDYEMSGKDLIDSVKISSCICKILGGTPPDGFHYELFLDEAGQKISKSRGNGLTIDEWFRYALPESLSLFMYQSPRKAKRLHFDVIPRNMDDYLTFLEKYHDASLERQIENPVWHIHFGQPPSFDMPVSFSMLLNLVSASNAEDRNVLWGFISRYAPGSSPQKHPMLDALVSCAISYFHDFVRPFKVYRMPNEKEHAALIDLAYKLRAAPLDADAQFLQNIVYEVGKMHEFENLRNWFKVIYEVLLGQSNGPRFGSFIALYGIEETHDLIMRSLAGELCVS